MIEHKLLVFLAPTKKNPHRILAILLDGTYPWYLTKDSNITNAAQEIFMHLLISKFSISPKDCTSFITSNQTKFDFITLSKRKTLSDFSFVVSSKYSTSSGGTNTLILTRNQRTKVKVTEFNDSRPLSVNNNGAVLITKYAFDAFEVLEFIELFNKMV